MRRRDRRLTMADDKDIVVEFLNSKSGSKSKFYFKDFLDLFPDKGPRDVKKILTKLVNEAELEFRFHHHVRHEGRGQAVCR